MRQTGRPVIAETRIRPLRSSDFAPVIAVIDEWWGGRPMAQMLPSLFFDHFTDTSFAAHRDGALAGFLVGFVSQSQPGDAWRCSRDEWYVPAGVAAPRTARPPRWPAGTIFWTTANRRTLRSAISLTEEPP